jgi:aminopeptidase N
MGYNIHASSQRRSKATSVRFVLVLALASASAAADVGARSGRLPLQIVPEHYVLRLTPNLASATFSGVETIRVRVLEPTAAITLNAAEIAIEEATIAANGVTERAGISYSAADETVSLQVPTQLPVGVATLHITYSGTLNRELRGFYLSEANGRRYAVTQLEATDARRMFPSFDEPAFKATFDITAVIDEDDDAISNGAVTGTTPGPTPGTKASTFATTPKMSTYLVALAAGDFECVPGRAVGSTPIRVCTTPGKRQLTEFPRAAAEGLLEYYNTYFATAYPFGKLDLVAIPDFAAGAMENTGAIFFRESLLLVDTEAPLEIRRRAALVIAHEIAHQWFGDLVTMRWWDDLWLNEGFATWMESKAVDHWRPDLGATLAARQAVDSAMSLDALATTRAVRAPADTPAAINEQFDPIAYEKGGAILDMVEAFIGERAFQGGVNAYLDQHAYGNATAEDFWNTMTRSSGKPVDRIMRSFVDQPGIPVVDVDLSCTAGGASLELRERRLNTHGPARSAGTPPAAGDAQRWAIPVCFRTASSNGGPRCELLDQDREAIRLPSCVPWAFVNAGGAGYYRSEYDPRTLAALQRAPLLPVEALTLLSDQWALLRAGSGDIGRFLPLVSALTRQTEAPEVVESSAARLQYVHEYLVTPASAERFERWVREHLPPIDGEAAELSREAPALMAARGIAGRDRAVLDDARERVLQALNAPANARDDSQVTSTLVELAALTGDRALYDRYLARSQSATTPAERYRFLYGLASFQDRDLTWRALQERWPEIQAQLAAFGGASRIIEGLGDFCSTARSADVRSFFERHRVADAEHTLRQSFERIERCAAFHGAQSDPLARWLQAETDGVVPKKIARSRFSSSS